MLGYAKTGMAKGRNEPIKHGVRWRIRWTENGERKSETYATRSDADLALRRHLVAEEERRRRLRRLVPDEDRTFAELATKWESLKKSKRSLRTDMDALRAHLLPTFGTMSLRTIDSEQCERFKAERARLKPKTLHNLLTLLVSMLRLAVDLGWLDSVPRVRKPKIVLTAASFKYFKSPEEVRRFLAAAREVSELAFMMYAVSIFTGVRLGELFALEWDCVDFDRKLITVSRSYGGPTKNERPRYVPLTDALAPLLRTWRLQAPGRLIFPTASGGMRQKSDVNFRKVFLRVLTLAGFPRGYVTPHSLRHTFASHWMMAGGDLYRLQRILGHSSQNMTLRYSHLSPDAFAGDLDRLDALAPNPGPASKVVTLLHHQR